MRSPVVLFDIDGTLLFFKGIGRLAMDKAMREEWGLEDPLAGVSFAGATDGAIAQRIGGGRAPEPMWRRYLTYLEALLRTTPHRDPLPGVVALLDYLEDKGARCALLTGNISGGARLKLEHVGLWNRFDLGLSAFAEDGGIRTEVADVARARCGSAPVVIVGDTAADVHAARHIGAPVLTTATGAHPRQQLEAAEPDLLVEDLTDTRRVGDWLLSRSSAGD